LLSVLIFSKPTRAPAGISSPNHVCRPLAQARPMPCARAHAEPRGCRYNCGQSAVDARGGAAPTGAAPVGTFSTPVREEQWRTCQQFSVHGGCPSPVSGGVGRGFAAALGSPHAIAWPWPSNMVAAPTACDLGTPGLTCSNCAPLGVLNRYVHAHIACRSSSR
jgi:hypothetical protein